MKVALITAGSGGIGKAVVDLFLNNNYYVSITGRSLDKLKTVFSNYDQSKLLYTQCDITNPISCQYIIEQTIERFGQLDVLVNTAGGATFRQTFENTSADNFQETFDLNVKSVYFMIQHALPYLIETRGSIINFSSVLGSRPVVGLGPYCASKAAVEMLTKSAALEFAPHKVRVNCVAPTAIKTNFHVNAGMTEAQAELYYQSCSKTHPLGRVGTADDVAEIVLFLAEHKKSGYMTGNVIHVDGGRLLTSSSTLN